MRKEKGFTFLEIMIALAILSVALIAALRAQSQSLSIATESVRNTNISFLVRQKMSDIELAGYNEVAESEGMFEKNPEYRWKVEVKETPFEELKDIILTISWQDGGKEKKYTVETFLVKND